MESTREALAVLQEKYNLAKAALESTPEYAAKELAGKALNTAHEAQKEAQRAARRAQKQEEL